VKPCPITTHGIRAANTSGRYQVAAIVSPPDGKQISEQATDRAPPGEAAVTCYGFRISLSSGAGITNAKPMPEVSSSIWNMGTTEKQLAQHGLSRALGTLALQLGTILAYELVIDQQRRNLDDASGIRSELRCQRLTPSTSAVSSCPASFPLAHSLIDLQTRALAVS
jgi:hypothetical protein